MATVAVKLGERSYPIYIEPGLLDRVGELVRERLPRAGRALIITDSEVGPLYAGRVESSLEAAGLSTAVAAFPAGEASKELQTAAALYRECAAAGLERSSVVVALGGGVVGDLAGFVAATYLRGLPFAQVPTTLLAQVDSSVGGKTGVDLPEGKNLVGAFHQPVLVGADPEVLRSLPRREVAAGMAEVVKHAVIRDPEFLTYLEAQADAILALDPAVLERVVEVNCGIKAAVVGADEREETGLRAVLNFGHTTGHAVEAAMGYGGWLHGECVAVGMVAALAISREAGVLAQADLPDRVAALLGRLGLPTRLPAGLELTALLPLMQRDKKVAAGRIHWVLAERAGRVRVTADVAADVVIRVLESLRG